MPRISIRLWWITLDEASIASAGTDKFALSNKAKIDGLLSGISFITNCSNCLITGKKNKVPTRLNKVWKAATINTGAQSAIKRPSCVSQIKKGSNINKASTAETRLKITCTAAVRLAFTEAPKLARIAVETVPIFWPITSPKAWGKSIAPLAKAAKVVVTAALEDCRITVIKIPISISTICAPMESLANLDRSTSSEKPAMETCNIWMP